jgi:outer membrane murein-binding lipoprotein Lpp
MKHVLTAVLAAVIAALSLAMPASASERTHIVIVPLRAAAVDAVLYAGEVATLEAENRQLAKKAKRLAKRVHKLERRVAKLTAKQRAAKRKARIAALWNSRPSNVVELGRTLQRLGYRVSEHPAFGGVAPGVHNPTGHHYPPCSCAIDVNWTGANEPAALDRAARFIRRLGARVAELLWRVSGHYDHLHAAMP